MLNRAAEESFRKGLEVFRVNGGGLQAMAFFEAALVLQDRESADGGEARYKSYYGLCQVIRGQEVNKGLALCREAARDEFFNPQMWLNLGRAEMKAGNRWRAHKAFLRGLRLAPENEQIRGELVRLGLRRRPFLWFLSRDHFLNVWLGKLTYPVYRRNKP